MDMILYENKLDKLSKVNLTKLILIRAKYYNVRVTDITHYMVFKGDLLIQVIVTFIINNSCSITRVDTASIKDTIDEVESILSRCRKFYSIQEEDYRILAVNFAENSLMSSHIEHSNGVSINYYINDNKIDIEALDMEGNELDTDFDENYMRNVIGEILKTKCHENSN